VKRHVLCPTLQRIHFTLCLYKYASFYEQFAVPSGSVCQSTVRLRAIGLLYREEFITQFSTKQERIILAL
jgi:hypothetical protein